jgi:hypothetical protein
VEGICFNWGTELDCGADEQLLGRTVEGIQALRQQVQSSQTELADKEHENANLNTPMKLLTNSELQS